MKAPLTRAGGRIGPISGVPTLMAGQNPLPAPVFCLMWDQAMHTEVVASLHCAGIGAFAVRTMITKGLVLLHAAYTGTHDLFFPCTARICELRSNTRVRTKAGRLTLQLKRGETRLSRWD